MCTRHPAQTFRYERIKRTLVAVFADETFRNPPYLSGFDLMRFFSFLKFEKLAIWKEIFIRSCDSVVNELFLWFR